MKRIGLSLVAALAAVSGAFCVICPAWPGRANEVDPLSVVQALMDAEHATDLDLALSLFADDAVIVNVAGATIAGARLRTFLEADIWMHETFPLEQMAVERNRVAWTRPITAAFYENIGVAPIRFAFTADVRKGKIKSIVAHVPLEEIARIENACRRRTPEPRIYGNPCSEFVESIKAESVLATAGADARR